MLLTSSTGTTSQKGSRLPFPGGIYIWSMFCKWLSRTGGVPVLAHPGASFQRVTREDLSALKKAGLQGLEVYSSYHDSEMAEFFREMAEEFDLVPTAGSDFHGRIKPKVKLGSIANGGYWMVEELRKRRPG